MSDDKVIEAAFGIDRAAALTGLSRRTLMRWDREGFYVPDMAAENRRLSHSRVYSFRDIVALRVLEQLYVKHKIPMRELRGVSKRLADVDNHYWSQLKFSVVGREVHFIEPKSGKPQSVISRQFVMGEVIRLEEIIAEVRKDVSAMRSRTKSDVGNIVSEASRHEATHFSGTRIPVKAVKNLISAGYTDEEILKEYPSLASGDLRAARKSAA